MSKNKKILLMVLEGGLSQADIAAVLHVSKREVSAAVKVASLHGPCHDDVAKMEPSEVDQRFFPKLQRVVNEAYLQPDMGVLVERKKKHRKLPVKAMWMEYCEAAGAAGRLAYSYQRFCEMFASEAERRGAVRHFTHEPGAKCFIDWAGDSVLILDPVTGLETKVWVPVVALPFSGLFWLRALLI